ncbi:MULTISPECIES: nucleoside hydrolase [unclassified Bacillus (in: firmicutes)]|uniref:nucleoside hydrolase n=1 Tax=unclassified Bacillus (in: firmicutes) TaxID=185979 RepID=UPI0008EE348C|nr:MULTISPECIES: nucleoside hydrolase [unclassified Bacillus (in: firmicutes)]SFA69572.1 purine nucleosidase [Bacillus sp. UNCCL13]SFQ58889.1 purine nucleosidase [Bacillus sp. cl95]
MPKKVLLFTDLGIDDAFALIYAFFHKGVEIVGIVADYGNVSRTNVIRNINYIKYLMGQEKIPVFLGASIPLTGISVQYFPEVHGEVGLGPITPPDIPYPVYPINDIYQIIDENIEDLTIINLGRLSSLATAFIINLEKMKNVKEYICMGGAFFYPGNVTAVAEANFYNDPYAANLILQHAKNLTIIPLNITQRALVTPEMVETIDKFHQKTLDPAGLIIKPMLDFYYKFYTKTNPGIKGSPMHDFMTIWFLLNPEFVSISKVPVKVIPDRGEGFGQSIADFRFEANPDYKMHNVAFQFDYEAFKRSILETLLKKR